MRKIYFVLAALCWLGACSTLGRGPGACPAALAARPDYFAQGQKLAAFRLAAHARGYGLDGILQIKKIEEDAYSFTLFSVRGGLKLAQGTTTAQGTAYSYLMKEAASAAVRAKADVFLKVLLFPPHGAHRCRQSGEQILVTYKDDHTWRYSYAPGAAYPRSVVYKKGLGSARMNYGQYTPYETGELPHELVYQDGALEVELALLSLKK